MYAFGSEIPIANLILFCFSVIGLTNIIVDPATIMVPIRAFLRPHLPAWVETGLNCYQCAGTWVGGFCGYFLLSHSIPVIIMSAFAGSFIATFGALFLNYLQTRIIVEMGSDE